MEKNVLNTITKASIEIQAEVVKLSAELYKVLDQERQDPHGLKTSALTREARHGLLNKWHLANKECLMRIPDKVSVLALEEKEEYSICAV